ncbi:PEGA domain-containing protein [Patescibacteria group bacterium]|nr:MAG: PEGA domain-containing protein [Patescibacteria group bacterium]
MKNRTQTLITVILMLLFLTSVPLVLLNTAGYRINIRTRQLERTGILILRSAPPDAHILLDGVLQDERTPARLSQLLPREYRVTAEREGYRPWSKLLTVESQRSTFAEDIILFPDQLPVRVADAAARSLAVAVDGTLVYDDTTGSTTEIHFLRPNGEETTVTRVSHRSGGDQWLRLRWSPDGRTVLAFGDIAPTLVSLDGAQRVLTVPGPLSEAVWSGQDLYLLADGRALVQSEDGATRPVTTSTAALLWRQEGLTYVGRAATGTISVDVLAANGSILRSALLRLPGNVGWYRFLPSPNGLLTLLGDGRVRVFDAESGATRIDRPAYDAVWRLDGTPELLLSTNFEIWTVNPDDQAQLLTRLGAPIRGAAWYPGGTHVLYASGDAVAAIERDDRGGRIITPLFTLPDLGAFIVDEKGAAVFAAAAPAGKPGIFRYPIVIP